MVRTSIVSPSLTGVFIGWGHNKPVPALWRRSTASGSGRWVSVTLTSTSSYRALAAEPSLRGAGLALREIPVRGQTRFGMCEIERLSRV